jgi:glycine dehydrogenase subunit 1
MSNYCPHTPDDIQKMLAEIGVSSIENLFSEIPEDLRLGRPIALPDGLSEPELVKKISDLARQNDSTSKLSCFLGGGAYDHYIPVAIRHLLQRGDFFTAYTPYQPEVSQGTLTAIYEYQSLMCELTGMDVANASMYEAATAMAESANIALMHTNRQKLILLESVNPQYREVTVGLTQYLGAQIVTIPVEDGVCDLNRLAEVLDDKTAGVFVQYPNFFGCIEDLEAISAMAKKVGALTLVSAYPIALGMLTSPGCLGADVVTGEGQSLGIPLGFGGPYLGFMAVRDHLLRKIPGRLAGRTTDKNGKSGFVLTLQAREQHIRRDKATSNICSNQALMALNATIFMCLLGNEGIKEFAHQSFQKAHYLKKELTKEGKITSPVSAPFFNEFVIKVPQARKTVKKMMKAGILAGIPLEESFPKLKDQVLVAVTEKRTLQEMDYYKTVLEGLV